MVVRSIDGLYLDRGPKIAVGSPSDFKEMSDSELTRYANELIKAQAKRGRVLTRQGKDPVETLKKLLREKIVLIHCD